MKVYAISAVTLFIENVEKSCNFYSRIPGFKLVYGGFSTDSFTTYEVGSGIDIGTNLTDLHKQSFKVGIAVRYRPPYRQ
jgi:catechol 2,3-dioxygenase-like lactoylglutathione lyase family enzyme